MANLVKTVQNNIFHDDLFARGGKILLAVSGGPDSICLFDIFTRFQKKYDLELAVVHVNYGLRGKDSERDEKFVRDMAGKHGLEIFVLDAGARSKKKCSENELRDIRYAFFEKTRLRKKFDLIAVAHNLDDQVETFFMRLLRGSGLSGLSGMKPKNGNIIRPLLSTSRQEIEKYLDENKIPFRIDRTNLRSEYFRNKIRNKFIPYLEKNYNQEIRKTIFDSMQSIIDDHDFLEKSAQKHFAGSKGISVSELLKLHPAIQKRVLRHAILEKKQDLKNIDASHIDEIIKAARSTKNKPQTVILKGLKIIRRGDKMNIEKIK